MILFHEAALDRDKLMQRDKELADLNKALVDRDTQRGLTREILGVEEGGMRIKRG